MRVPSSKKFILGCGSLGHDRNTTSGSVLLVASPAAVASERIRIINQPHSFQELRPYSFLKPFICWGKMTDLWWTNGLDLYRDNNLLFSGKGRILILKPTRWVNLIIINNRSGSSKIMFPPRLDRMRFTLFIIILLGFWQIEQKVSTNYATT